MVWHVQAIEYGTCHLLAEPAVKIASSIRPGNMTMGGQ